MKTEIEIDAEIRYAQGYLDGLRFALDKTEAEAKKVVATTRRDNYRMERELCFSLVLLVLKQDCQFSFLD